MAPGPYNVPNIRTDSLCVYTNHPFATAYRGFGHEVIYPVERALDLLADELEMDPVELRIKNAIRPGDLSPTQSVMDPKTGDLPACLRRAAEMIDWDEGPRIELDDHRVRAKGISVLWKSPAMPTNTDAGLVLTFNEDGSVNVSTGIIEIGQGTYTGLAQIVAEPLRMPPEMVHIAPEIHTHDRATAASRSLFMTGRAASSPEEDE
jgi:CO/xanthine dehydrogenase Mo-binding subunit